MWFNVKDMNNIKHYLNTEHLTNIYSRGEETVICSLSGVVVVKGDITKEIAETIRKTGTSIVKIGE